MFVERGVDRVCLGGVVKISFMSTNSYVYNEYSCVCDGIHMYHLTCSCYSTTQRG